MRIGHAHIPRSPWLVVAAVAVSIITGCGSSGAGGQPGGVALGAPSRSNRLVDLRRGPPYVRAFAINPKDSSILLATNVGLYRISADGGTLEHLAGRVAAGRATGAYGRKVSAFAALGPDRLIGSGHPDGAGRLPGFLGVMKSVDGGRSWRSVARVGLSDLHVITVTNGTIYAFDTVLGGVIVSRDGGRTFDERSAPPGPVVDLAADPGDRRHLLASTPGAIFNSTDEGLTWRTSARASGAVLAWSRDRLVRADVNGSVKTSPDRGHTWKEVGRLPASAGKLIEPSHGELYAALVDGSIDVSRDGGRTWRRLFRP